MSNLPTPWPADLPPLADVQQAARRERGLRRNVYTKKVRAGEMSPEEARHQYDCCLAWEHLVEAEIRRGQPWPMLSPTPAQLLEWLTRKVSEAQRNQQQDQLMFWNVLRWLVLADVDHRATEPHPFEAPLPAPR